MDVHAKNPRRLALQIEREIAPAGLIEVMREPMGHERVEPLEVKQRLHVALARRVAIAHREQIGPERCTKIR